MVATSALLKSPYLNSICDTEHAFQRARRISPMAIPDCFVHLFINLKKSRTHSAAVSLNSTISPHYLRKEIIRQGDFYKLK